MSVTASRPAFSERKRVLLLVDLAGFTRSVAGLGAVEIATLVDAFYRLAGAIVETHGGRVVKFVGDGCFAVFDEAGAAAAVACARSFRDPVIALGHEHNVTLDIGANVHLATVVEGSFGAGASARDDVMGAGVIHTFRMGSGRGIRISEPVYRKQPNDDRKHWHKHQPPATYTLQEGDDA
jgi:adenylate cyclase